MARTEGDSLELKTQGCNPLKSAHLTQLTWASMVTTIALQTRQSLNLQKILQTTVDGVHQLLGCDRVLIYQFTPDWSGAVVVEAVSTPQWSLLGRVVHNAPLEPNQLDFYREGQFDAIEDVATADINRYQVEFLAKFQVRANLGVPILHREDLWGLLIAHSCDDPRQWQATEIEGLKQVAIHVGIAIRQASLIEQLQIAKANLEAQMAVWAAELEDTNQRFLEEVYEHSQVAITVAQREEFLRQVLDSLFIFVGVLTPTGILIETNQTPVAMAGLTREDVLGKPFAETYWWSYSTQAQETIREAIVRAQQGIQVHFDIPVQVQGGDHITIDLSLTPLRDHTGTITHLVSSGIDITDRKQTEIELRESKEKFEDFFDNASDLIQSFSLLDGRFLYVNRTWRETLGYKLDEITGLSIFDVIAPNDLPYCQNLFQQFQRGESHAIEHIRIAFLAKDGHEVLLEGNINVRVENNSPVATRAIFRDITAQRKAETDLKAAKDQLELFIQATSEGFWDWDLITGDIYFSPHWKEMLGYADHELENSFHTWETLIFEEDRATTLQLIEDYNGGKVNHFSTTQRFHHKNGSTVYILSRAIHVKNEQNVVIRMVGSHLDMTPMVEMQKALEISEMQLSGVLNSSLDGIMAFRSVFNDQGIVIDFEWLLSNSTACALIGRETEELVGKRLLKEISGHRNEGLFDRFDRYIQVVETGDPIQRQFHYKQDGIDRWFETIAVKLGDGFAVTFRNITAIKQSEQALQRANHQLEDRLGALKQLNDEMLLLSETSDFLQACLTIEEACAVITSLVEPLFPGCSGGIFITSASRNRVENMASWGAHLHSQTEFYPQDCWGLRRGRLHWVGPHRMGLRCKHIHSTSEISDTLCIPMIAQGEALGLFYLSAETQDALPETKQQLARTVAEQVALALANLHLRETLQHQSIRDPLTGLFNRRYLEESLQQEISRAQRYQRSIGVIMMDVDHFKQFNDTYGHETGDHVLQTIGKLLKESVRGSDIACRYGGEEIVLVLSESTLPDTQARAESIREAISKLRIHQNGKILDTLTASFGVSSFPQHGAIGSALVQAADAALYRAKAAGRNQVVAAT